MFCTVEVQDKHHPKAFFCPLRRPVSGLASEKDARSKQRFLDLQSGQTIISQGREYKQCLDLKSM